MAYDFDGTDDEITYGTTDLLGSGADASYACWIKPTTSAATASIFNKRDAFSASSTTGCNFNLGHSSGAALQFNKNANVFTSGLTVSDGSWQFVGFRGLSADSVMYLDTSSETTTEWQTGNDTGAVITLGGLSVENGERFDGFIAEVAAWAGDIGEVAMLAMADRYSPLFFAHYGGGMKFYAPIVRDADAIYVNGLAATVTGATVADHPPGFIYPSIAPVVFAPAAAEGGIIPQFYHHRFHNLAV